MNLENVEGELSEAIVYEQYRWFGFEKLTCSLSTSHTPQSRSIILSPDEWRRLDLTTEETDPVIGDTRNPIVRPLTKNFVEAPEKSFKTTFLMRLAAALATGAQLLPGLPIPRARKLVYLHGELSKAEIRDRLGKSLQGVTGDVSRFLCGRNLDVSLATPEGCSELRHVVEEFKPEVLIIDPWQSFIAGLDENSFKDISSVTNFFDRLIDDFNLTLFIAIHYGKDSSRGPRGHSNLAGWRDSRFVLSRPKNKPQLTVSVDPRWASAPKPIKLLFQNDTVWPIAQNDWTGQSQQIRQLVEQSGGRIPRQQVGTELQLSGSGLRMAIGRAKSTGAVKADRKTVSLP